MADTRTTPNPPFKEMAMIQKKEKISQALKAMAGKEGK